MKKLPISLVVLSLALAAPFARADGQTFYYWANTNGGNWTASANWVMEDGSAATTYPHVAGDVAVFNGLAAYKTVSVNQSDVIDIDELRLDDGCIRLGIRSAAHFHADRLLRSDHAVLYLVTSGSYNHASPNDTTIGNRDEVLFNGGFLPGAMVCKDDGAWGGNVRSATIDAETQKLKYGTMDSPAMAYDVNGDSSWGKDVSMYYANNGTYRHISFKKECVLTVACGQISPMSANSHVGNPSSTAQGTINTAGTTLYFWPLNTTCFRAKVVTPLFVQSGHYTTLFCDDHSSETNEYHVASGTMRLGSVPPEGADMTVTNRCVLGTGPVVVSWAGTLDVGAGDAMKNAEYLKMTSFRGLGQAYGKIHMSTNAVVDWFWLDDRLQKRGTHGATGSGAEFVDDAIFSGPGLLTVKKGHDGTLFLIY